MLSCEIPQILKRTVVWTLRPLNENFRATVRCRAVSIYTSSYTASWVSEKSVLKLKPPLSATISENIHVRICLKTSQKQSASALPWWHKYMWTLPIRTTWSANVCSFQGIWTLFGKAVTKLAMFLFAWIANYFEYVLNHIFRKH